MFNLRATAKLLRRLKCPPAEPGATTTLLGDWYGNLFYWGRQQFCMFTSERSLLTVVLPAKEIYALPTALTDALGRLLSELGLAQAIIDDELNQMQQCVVTATASRKVLGSMNDFTFAAKHYLADASALPLAEIAHRLSETPMSVFGYRYPREVALELLAGANTYRSTKLLQQ